MALTTLVCRTDIQPIFPAALRPALPEGYTLLSKHKLSEYISLSATTALLYEVSAAPKPGLVDRFNQGAHKDMDFFSFMASSAALSPYFHRCAEKGAEFAEACDSKPKLLFESLRPLGITAEKAMYEAAGGANTHKGLIFSIGIISAAAAFCYMKDYETDSENQEPVIKNREPVAKTQKQIMKHHEPYMKDHEQALEYISRYSNINMNSGFINKEQDVASQKTSGSLIINRICSMASLMTQGICARELESMPQKDNPTHGERVYLEYGARGIRGEVEGGFPTVRNHSLPAYYNLKAQNCCSYNDILVQTILHIMAVNEDTNVLARHDRDALEYVRNSARKAIDAGGVLTRDGTEMIYEMDRDFIQRNISPGGAADLLAVTIMLERISDLNLPVFQRGISCNPLEYPFEMRHSPETARLENL